jgi:hypothetical protein
LGQGKQPSLKALRSSVNSYAAKYNLPTMTSCQRPHTDLHTTVMERDRRLTGFMRGQTDKAEAPAGFELNNPWRVRIINSEMIGQY